MLNRQVFVYSVDTGNFYSNRERTLHWKNHKLKIERNKLKTIYDDLEKKLLHRRKFDGSNLEVKYKSLTISRVRELIKYKNKLIKETKQELLDLLDRKVKSNQKSNGKNHSRVLTDNLNPDINTISIFESTFTRMIGAEPDTITEDFMVVQVYYFDVLKDLIYNGYFYKGEKYIYFTSSAGQIRTKKCVFIKESVYKKYEKTIMCGLTLEDINANGGNNPNKHLAYLALINSATDEWINFDIDRVIVVDDFETEVYGGYDLVDDETYKIHRSRGHIPVPHMDGAGLILPRAFGEEQTDKMIRLAWVKGLLTVFPFKRFVQEKGCSPKVKDIYGKEWDIIEDRIEVILTKSQFKLWRFFDSWDTYKENFKKYNCKAGYTNPEEERIPNATINYQMLQTLTDYTEDELDDLTKKSVERVLNVAGTIEDMQRTLGITPYNTNKTYLQKSIELYPDLMKDVYIKDIIRDIKNGMVKRYKSGSLEVEGKYTFIVPDVYAFCEWLFLGIENPLGLLRNGEVYCDLFRKSMELDCLRSPHLYKEHAIRNNTACKDYSGEERLEELKKWFRGKGLYTSTKDLISKLLMFDVDGDKSLVVSDPALIKLAKKNMKNIVPLYYNMRKAQPCQINSDSIYNGLVAAFTGGNIGIYSNNISKIWNSEVFRVGSEEQKEYAIEAVKRLCMENNFVIDYAKTLYKPECPPTIKEGINYYTSQKLPRFFIYAKDKTLTQTSNITKSLVNRLDKIIPNPNLNMRKVGLHDIDYKNLMSNPNIEVKLAYNEDGSISKRDTDPMILKYFEINRKYGYKVKNKEEVKSRDTYTKPYLKAEVLYNKIAVDARAELSEFGYTDEEICDILVKVLYGIKDSRHKALLWFCYGEQIYNNIRKRFTSPIRDVECVDCGLWFTVRNYNSATNRCPECYKEYRREYYRLNKRKQRASKSAYKSK